jgi:integrase
MPRLSDSLVVRWVETEFANANTRKVYLTSLKKFSEVMGIVDFSSYLKDLSPEKALEDVKRFLGAMNGAPSCTTSSYLGCVRVFLREQGVEIKDSEFRKLRSRGFAPKRVMPKTRDRAPSADEVRKILDYSDIKGRALFLFLMSSGCRIGETCQLRVEDLKLEADPPEAFIRGESSKGGVGERYVFFSYEARDALQNWLSVKPSLTKRMKDGGSYESGLVFPFNPALARFFLRRALKKAGLDRKDPVTNIGEIHVHSFRKFFRSNVGLNIDEVHTLMGHVEYLDRNYLRLNKEKVAENYKRNISRVSVYSMDQSRLSALEQKLSESEGVVKVLLANGKNKDGEIEDLKAQMNEMNERVEKLFFVTAEAMMKGDKTGAEKLVEAMRKYKP